MTAYEMRISDWSSDVCSSDLLIHASTSPVYPLFASLDVGAQMMKGRSGVVLWDDTIRLGIEIRKKMRAMRREFATKETDPARQWFFDPFVPDVVDRDGGSTPWEDRSAESRVGKECVSTVRSRWSAAH